MKFTWKGKEWYIHKTLAYQLVSLIYNLKHDWDFVILISGDRKVRVGKSVLAMTICAFLAYLLSILKTKDKLMNRNAYNLDNVFFDNKDMIKEAPKRVKFSVIHYDEGREGLAAIKAMRQFQQDLIDFFNECGQLNHIFVVVCPDFFDLKEDIAVGRSEFLINVYRRELKKEMDIFNDGTKIPVTVLQRGHFEFFSRSAKALLFDIAKNTRRKNYHLVKADFLGDFTNQYPLDEEEYRKRKSDSFARFKERHTEQETRVDNSIRNGYIIHRHKEGAKAKEISKELEIIWKIDMTTQRINQIIKEEVAKEAKSLENEGLKTNGKVSKYIMGNKGVIVEKSS